MTESPPAQPTETETVLEHAETGAPPPQGKMIYADLEYDDGTTHRQALAADESKKSVYWLKDLPTTSLSGGGGGGGGGGDPNATNNNNNNIKALVLVAADGTKNAFHIGGFQLQGLAKIIKVYVDDADHMIMSVRGIKSTRLQAFFKAQCVIPGGARPVADFVRLELEPAAAIHQVRWTIRMRDSDTKNDTSRSGGERTHNDGHAVAEQQHRNGDAAASMPVSTDEASNSSMGFENSSFSFNGGGGGSFSNHMNGDVSERGEDTGMLPMPEPPPSMVNLHSSTPVMPSALLQSATTLVESTMSSTLLLGGGSTAAATMPRSTNNNGVAMSNGTCPDSSTVAAAGGGEASIAALAHHMADLTSAMRELTATIKEHQRFLQEQQQQQRPPDRS